MPQKQMNMTEGLRNFVKMALVEIEAGNCAAAKMLLTDLENDIGIVYVCIEDPSSAGYAVVPTYNPGKDGDYHKWLIANNID